MVAVDRHVLISIVVDGNHVIDNRINHTEGNRVGQPRSSDTQIQRGSWML